MKAFTAQRGPDTPDAVWTLQHPSIYTQGLNCKIVPFVDTDIPILKTDRGGQITYHGPGQLVIYALIDLRRRNRGVKWLVQLLEQSVIDLLAGYDISAGRRAGAPGVYVRDEKVAALGLRVRRGASYHGLSLNIDMDLTPFSHIHPCGYEGLKVTQLKNLGVSQTVSAIRDRVSEHLRIALQADADTMLPRTATTR